VLRRSLPKPAALLRGHLSAHAAPLARCGAPKLGGLEVSVQLPPLAAMGGRQPISGAPPISWVPWQDGGGDPMFPLLARILTDAMQRSVMCVTRRFVRLRRLADSPATGMNVISVTARARRGDQTYRPIWASEACDPTSRKVAFSCGGNARHGGSRCRGDVGDYRRTIGAGFCRRAHAVDAAARFSCCRRCIARGRCAG
jgi:hypothetical protein